jgi:hypothetical protein
LKCHSIDKAAGITLSGWQRILTGIAKLIRRSRSETPSTPAPGKDASKQFGAKPMHATPKRNWKPKSKFIGCGELYFDGSSRAKELRVPLVAVFHGQKIEVAGFFRIIRFPGQQGALKVWKCLPFRVVRLTRNHVN